MLESNCPYGDESLIVADYLAGRLSGAKAQAFEAHSFGCERCFEELQRAVEVRVAGDRLASGADDGQPAVRTDRQVWPLLGMAAAVVLAAGLWFAQPLFDDVATPPVYRDGAADTGTEPVLQLTVVPGKGDVSLRWEAITGADAYRLRIFTEGGDPILERETIETSIELSPDTWRQAGRPGAYYGQVIALDELRQIIAQSGFEPL